MKVLFREYCSTLLIKVSDVATIDNVVLFERDQAVVFYCIK